MAEWRWMLTVPCVEPRTSDMSQIHASLLEYCKLDT